MYDREEEIHTGAEMNTGATLSVICRCKFVLYFDIRNIKSAVICRCRIYIFYAFLTK